MSDQPVNLNKARKAKARAQKAQQAAENRAKFGRTKADRQADAARRAKAEKELASKKRET